MDTKSCSFCKEEISVELRRCPYCGSLLESINKDKEIVLANQDSEAKVTQMCVEQNDDGTIVIKECTNTFPAERQNNTENQIAANLTQNPLTTKSNAVTSSSNNMSNGLKVFLTILSTMIPGLGQLIGIIISVVFINSEDTDKNSFGVALMIASLLFFVIFCISIFILIVAFVMK